MSMYPSLEDMKVDQMAKAQQEVSRQVLNAAGRAPPAAAPVAGAPYPLQPAHGGLHAYPALGEYMGLEFTHEVLALNMPEYIPGNQQLAQHYSGQVVSATSGFNQQLVAPVSNSAINTITKTAPSNTIRQVVVCKDGDGKVGVRVKDINKGVFVCLVMKDSPAALAGLRFGDQILEIDGTVVAGYSMDKVHAMIKKSATNGITMAVRDRPFERSITLHKDSTGHIGFQFKDGEVVAIVKDSSAARNGLLTNHHLLEINGQNVVGLKDKEVTAIINDSGSVVTVTITPSFVYNHMMKHMASSLKKIMDHALPLL